MEDQANQTEQEANLRIAQCLVACAGVDNPQPNELAQLRNQSRTYENFATQMATELNDKRAHISHSKYIILNLQNLETYKGVDGYTETFGEESQAIDVAHQFVGMFQIIPVNV